MSPISRGMSLRIPSIDGILHFLGISHPSITIQLLISVGFMVLGLGTLETSTILPVPLYSCWSSLTAVDLSGKNICESIALLHTTPVHEEIKLWACGADSWWQPTYWPGIVIAAVRAFIAICAGVALDVFGRRRCAIAWMGLYFIFSFARSFAPEIEVFVLSITVEGHSAQAATMALLLLASEGSTQKECVRSACLVLMGHALGCAVLIPVINSQISNEMFRQLARSGPSILFVLFIFFLPESFRWIVSRGRLEQAPSSLKKSHDVVLEDSMKGKFSMVYEEICKSLTMCKSRGNVVKQAIVPLFLSRVLCRVSFPMICISFLIGSAIGFRHIHDPIPYQSVEDRVVAFGVAELLALQFLGLILARISVRKVLFSFCGVFIAAILMTKALRTVGYYSCIADVFFSTGGHFVSVLIWVWLVIGVIRLTPTHSRGTMMGLTMGFGTLGHALSLLMYKLLTDELLWEEYYCALFFAALVVLAGLLVLILPPTPSVLPDMTSHLAPQFHWLEDDDHQLDSILETRMENGRTEENTRL